MARNISLGKLLLPPAYLLTSIIPSMIYMVLHTDSMAYGIALCAAAWITVGIVRGKPGIILGVSECRLVGLVLMAATLLFVQGTVVDTWFGGVNFGRLIGATAILGIMFMGAYVTASCLLAASPQLLTSTARFAFYSLLLIGFGAVAGVPRIGTAVEGGKAVVVFSEPSHFSFVYLPVLIFMVANATRMRQILLLGLTLLLAVKLENLTMIVGFLGASALVLRRTQLVVLLGIVAAAGVVAAVDVSYYADRLILDENSDNLSTLVFLQGWQRAWLNLAETRGLGVGFDQFGIVGSLGDIARRIYHLAGGALNLYDGGSTGSKLIAELGAVGVIMIAIYMRLAVRGALLIRRAQQLPVRQRDAKSMFLYSIILAYGSELFIRGTGYLSPSAFLCMSALIAVLKLDAARHRASDLSIGQAIANRA